ncbi:MAG: UDP-N-acetylmuramate--L-alanine ligase [Hydrogenobacter sp.]|uniref:UDP-N-acetylmuramate--L-alanine ligase n=1 Tax=Hydrogenobacter thermophilus TaxID=940 RepID=UPI0030FC581F
MFRERIRRFHFVGIGGIGMSGIAQVLLEMGYKVSGSDLRESKNVELLRKKGAKISIGHKPENVENVDVVVYSSAVSEDNPEIIQAKRMGIPTISRGEMLAELFRIREGIAVCGSHGKTTTTSMIAHIVHDAGYDPTVIIGGVLQKFGGNARFGKDDLIISEADESDGSFLKLMPTVAVITNIDREHLGYYKDLEEIKSAFLRFANSVPFYGFCVMNADDENSKDVMKKVKRRLITFGIKESSDVMARSINIERGCYQFDLYFYEKPLERIKLSVAGRHNVYNALASVAVSLQMGISVDTIKKALETFKNAERRLEFKGYFNGALVYDDYGHHPTEIKAVISALREMYPKKRLLLVFQPHRYSRTYYLLEEFAQVLKESDVCFLTDIYSAGEENLYGVSAEVLAKLAGCNFFEDRAELFNAIRREARDTDVILFMGAGSISKWCEEFLEPVKI